MFKLNAKFIQIIQSIPSDKVENWSYVHNEGASPNWKLEVLSYEKIRAKVEKGTGLKHEMPLKGDIQEGMPESGAAWIYTATIPGSDCWVAVYKHYVRRMSGMQLLAFSPAYGVNMNSPDGPVSDWRVYNIKGAVFRIKFWVDKLTGISKYT